MGNQGYFLVNTAFSSQVTTAGSFDVSNRAARLTVSGLEGDDVVSIEVWVGPDPVKGDGAWQPLFHAGSAVELTATDTQRIIVLIGQYRAVYAGAGDVKCYFQEDTLELDGNIVYPFNQPYIAGGGGGGGGFTLTAGDTNSVDMHFSGTSSSGTVSADSKISANAGNQISVESDGLFVPAGGGGAFNMPISLESANFTVGATYHAYAIEDPDTSAITATLPATTAAAGQIYFLEAEYDGSSGTHAGITVTPTGSDTINQSLDALLEPGMVGLFYSAGTDNRWMLANYIQISTAVGNLAEWRPDIISHDGGLYVPPIGEAVPNGTVDLVAGTATVNTGLVTADSLIFLTAQTLGTVTLGQGLAVSARVPGTSFTITSGSATDTSTVAWMIVEPA